MKVTYDWLKEYVGDEMPSLEKLEELLTFHAFEVDGIEKVGGHDVIDVKVLPDRASDSLSHRGVAREIATLIGKPLVKDPFKGSAQLVPVTEKVRVSIENTEHCQRFAVALIANVTVKESPPWLQSRLEALGQRSINNVVDATNYVMLALGQPLHAYDAKTFEEHDGMWHFGVRMSLSGEEVTILNGETLTLPKDVALITNAFDNTPVGIAGIKGGKSAEINADTTTIILESAHFHPQVIRKGSQLIKLQTDASKRFENNISSELVPYALEECVDLITSIAGGKCEGYSDTYEQKHTNPTVVVKNEQVNAVLGLELSTETIEDICRRLGFAYTREDSAWRVVAPFERTDINIPEDVIAEIGRVYGYEHIQAVLPQKVALTEYNARYYYSEKIRSILARAGFSEVITSSFRKTDVIELQNALASDKRYLRSNLREHITEALTRNFQNVDVLGLTKIQIFEIGTVFTKSEDGTDVHEHISLAFGVRTKQNGPSPKDDARALEVLEVLTSALGIKIDGASEQGIIEYNMSALLPQLTVPTEYEAFQETTGVTFVPYSLYPSMTRDVAFWADETSDAESISALIKETAGALLAQLSVFDEFKKEGKVSYGFRLVFQAFDRTLSDVEINPIMERVYSSLTKKGYEIR